MSFIKMKFATYKEGVKFNTKLPCKKFRNFVHTTYIKNILIWLITFTDLLCYIYKKALIRLPYFKRFISFNIIILTCSIRVIRVALSC